MAYGFNHDEAAPSFREAARFDPGSAMPHWGIALVRGPNINLSMSPEAEEEALGALAEAQARHAGASEAERDYVAALSTGYGRPAGAARAARDSAYADAMRALMKKYPDDLHASSSATPRKRRRSGTASPRSPPASAPTPITA